MCASAGRGKSGSEGGEDERRASVESRPSAAARAVAAPAAICADESAGTGTGTGTGAGTGAGTGTGTGTGAAMDTGIGTGTGTAMGTGGGGCLGACGGESPTETGTGSDDGAADCMGSIDMGCIDMGCVDMGCVEGIGGPKAKGGAWGRRPPATCALSGGARRGVGCGRAIATGRAIASGIDRGRPLREGEKRGVAIGEPTGEKAKAWDACALCEPATPAGASGIIWTGSEEGSEEGSGEAPGGAPCKLPAAASSAGLGSVREAVWYMREMRSSCEDMSSIEREKGECEPSPRCEKSCREGAAFTSITSEPIASSPWR